MKLEPKLISLFQKFISGPLTRGVRFSILNPGVIMSGALASILICFGLIGGGRLPFSFLPSIQGETVVANLQMPPGTSVERTLEVIQEIETSVLRAGDRMAMDLPSDHPSPIQNLYSVVGGGGGGGGLGRLTHLGVHPPAEHHSRLSCPTPR